MRGFKFICGLFAFAFLFGGCQKASDSFQNNEVFGSAKSQARKAVSTSLCGDTYLLRFATEAIEALSWQSRSSLSRANTFQKGLPQVNPSLESVLKYREAFIIFGPGEMAPHLHGLSDQTSASWIELTWSETFAGVSKNAKKIVSKLNQPFDEVDQWSLELENIIKRGENIAPAQRPNILYLTPSGGSAGPDTFVDEVIKAAGGVNINDVRGWHSPDLETILTYEPDIVMMSFTKSAYHTRSDIMNPALDNFLSGKKITTIDGAYWPCAGPGLLEATRDLQTAILNWIENNGA